MCGEEPSLGSVRLEQRHQQSVMNAASPVYGVEPEPEQHTESKNKLAVH